MKTTLLISMLFTVTLALGCKPTSEKPALQTAETSAPKSEIARVEVTDVAVQEKAYNFGQKTEFVMAMRAQFTELKKGIDEVAASAEKSSEAVQAEAKPRLVELQEKASLFEKQLTEIANATLPTWNVMKADVESAYASLKDGLARSKQVVSAKVAP